MYLVLAILYGILTTISAPTWCFVVWWIQIAIEVIELILNTAEKMSKRF